MGMSTVFIDQPAAASGYATFNDCCDDDRDTESSQPLAEQTQHPSRLTT
jgi:hypothetical protein